MSLIDELEEVVIFENKEYKDINFLTTREWLNPIGHPDTGAIEVKVSGNNQSSWVDASVDVWDCGRKISLDFNFNNEKTAQQRAEKIDLMIKVLTDTKTALGKAFDNMVKIRENDDE